MINYLRFNNYTIHEEQKLSNTIATLPFSLFLAGNTKWLRSPEQRKPNQRIIMGQPLIIVAKQLVRIDSLYEGFIWLDYMLIFIINFFYRSYIWCYFIDRWEKLIKKIGSNYVKFSHKRWSILRLNDVPTHKGHPPYLHVYFTASHVAS